MTRESRDPLSVLRGLRDEMRGLPHSLGYEYTHMAKVDEAIAQVEALAVAMNGLLSIHDSVTMGQEAERKAEWIPKARVAAAPFTPTDSEGGGHG